MSSDLTSTRKAARLQRKILIAFAALLILGFASVQASAEARAFINGKELLRLCDGAAADGFTRATDCLGYISGLSDAHEVFIDLGLAPKQWCWPPDGISNRRMAAIVHRYLLDNPAWLEKSAALLSFFALFEAFPCD